MRGLRQERRPDVLARAGYSARAVPLPRRTMERPRLGEWSLGPGAGWRGGTRVEHVCERHTPIVAEGQDQVLVSRLEGSARGLT